MGARRSGCPRWVGGEESGVVSAEDLEKYETEMELTLYKEYRDIVSQFSYVVETERRFYLANSVDVHARNADGEIYFEVRCPTRGCGTCTGPRGSSRTCGC
jgi:hypothetical protein